MVLIQWDVEWKSSASLREKYSLETGLPVVINGILQNILSGIFGTVFYSDM